MKYFVPLIALTLLFSGCGTTQVAEDENVPVNPPLEDQGGVGDEPFNQGENPPLENESDIPSPQGEILDGEENGVLYDPMQDYIDRKSAMSDTEISGNASVSFSNTFEGQVDKANVWLFPIPDDQGKIVFSTERNNEIHMSVPDLDNPGGILQWTTVISSSQIDGNKIADHWHVFAHGYHWITFSVTQANGAYLIKIDRDLNLVALEKIVDDEGIPTNDMFLVDEPSGVAAGFFLPGVGHQIFRFDTDLNEIDRIEIGGGEYMHGNGSSAILASDGIHVLAADQMNVISQGGVRLFKYDFDWNFISSTDLVDFENTNIGMVSGVYLDDGSLVMTARVNLDAYGRGEMPPPPNELPGGSLEDDGGYIGRYLFDSNLELASIEYLYEDGNNAHRPHVSVLEDQLYTGWDFIGKSTLRIDQIK